MSDTSWTLHEAVYLRSWLGLCRIAQALSSLGLRKSFSKCEILVMINELCSCPRRVSSPIFRYTIV
jgi:hypothetical protein